MIGVKFFAFVMMFLSGIWMLDSETASGRIIYFVSMFALLLTLIKIW